jgi:hypothetical protein
MALSSLILGQDKDLLLACQGLFLVIFGYL